MPLKLRFIIILFLASLASLLPGQALSIEEVIIYPTNTQEELAWLLNKKGWSNHNFEMKSDSNFNRRTWVIENTYNDLKSYFISYEYITDTSENYIIYQFADRPAFKNYFIALKEKGFKKSSVKSKSKRKNKKDNHKEIEEIYYSEKYNSIIVLKDVFFYGMNTFLVYSYKYKSAIGKNILHRKD